MPFSRLATSACLVKLNVGTRVELDQVDEANAKPPSLEVTSPWLRLLVGRRPKRTIVRLVILVVVVFVLFKFVFIGVRIEGISMEPTYHNGRIGLVERVAYRHSLPKRGDVVAIRIAGERRMYLKRVIGLPGERVAIHRGSVYINGEKLEEPYVRAPREPWEEPEVRLGEHEYYVVGDNRSMPGRWHEHGRVDASRIAGKLLF
jgi:signal peptidase I